MIHTTRLNSTELVVNSDLIEHIEATPDTVITLINGKKWIVQESVEEVVARVVAYQRAVRSSRLQPAGGRREGLQPAGGEGRGFSPPLAAVCHEAGAGGE